MGQKSLIYSLVARDMVIIAEYTELKKKLTCDESHCLQKSLVNDKIYTHNCDGHTFNFLMDNGLARRSLVLVELVTTMEMTRRSRHVWVNEEELGAGGACDCRQVAATVTKRRNRQVVGHRGGARCWW
ncbi:hypothetical protein E3N88_32570 [Mikania micrantha]|uniref:Uncharacterized protein n=1 Tax=Mikania micrantha TaxID=192012 RepID=A0A5N6M8X3_9ASTR|nr:hypothetical protein E3N88_32570 [Mikania micrantha]